MPHLSMKRRKGESLLLTVGEHAVRVLVTETHAGSVQLVVEAPAEVCIRREPRSAVEKQGEQS